MKKFAVILFILLSAVGLLAACAPKNPLIGEWVLDKEKVTLLSKDCNFGINILSDTQMEWAGVKFKYENLLNANLKFDELGGVMGWNPGYIHNYEVDGDTLVISRVGLYCPFIRKK